ncbi:MAG: decaprenyl-phosphate phosphoribosyltransferase [bacterium]
MIKNYVRLIRPKHWVKNLFLFLPLLFGLQIFNPKSLLTASVAFVSFCFAASSIYIFNDIMDLQSDRFHPIKKHRPLASGEINVTTAYIISTVLALMSLFLGFFCNIGFVLVVVTYMGINILYSIYLKNVVILDVFIIALGFVLRIVAGSVATNIYMSKWILLCGFTLSLFLGFTKRRAEMVELGEGFVSHRAVLSHYNPYFLDTMINIVNSLTVITYLFYTIDSTTTAKFGNKLFLSLPIVLYGIFRYQYLIYHKGKSSSPTENFLTDIPLLSAVIIWAIFCGGIIFFKIR